MMKKRNPQLKNKNMRRKAIEHLAFNHKFKTLNPELCNRIEAARKAIDKIQDSRGSYM